MINKKQNAKQEEGNIIPEHQKREVSIKPDSDLIHYIEKGQPPKKETSKNK